MPTATEPPPETVAAPAGAFEFNDAGVCLNPEKIHIRCNALGAACALLVARDESTWVAGYQCGGRNVAYTTNSPSRWSAHPRATRDEALRVAREGVLGYLRGINEPSAVAIRAGLEAYFGDANPAVPVPDDVKRTADLFRFDDAGICTNPLRVEIPCPEGYACALLVAQMEDNTWTFGCERTGPNGESFKYAPERIANGENTSESAVENALAIALEGGEPDSPINRALEKWRASHADAKLVAAPVEPAPAPEAATPAAEADAPDASEIEVDRRSPSHTRVSRGGVLLCDLHGPGPNHAPAVAALRAGAKPDGEFQTRFAIEVIRPEDVVSAAGQLPNEHGVYEKVERAIKFRDKEKKVSATVVLVPLRDGRCAAGKDVQFHCGDMMGQSGGPSIGSIYPTERAAVLAMLDEIAASAENKFPRAKGAGGCWTAAQGKAARRLANWVAEQRVAWEHGSDAAPAYSREGYPPSAEPTGEPEEKSAAPESLPRSAPTAPETDLATASAPVLPGMAHAVNEHGVFTTWDEVKILLPKRASGTIRLSLAPDGRWAYGLALALPTCSLAEFPNLRLANHETRGAALDAAYRVAFAFFREPGELSASERKLADRAADAIQRIREDYRPKLVAPDAATAPADAPAAAPRPAPVYRTEFAELPLGKIQENPANHRKHYDAAAIRELADSLLSEGLHQPVAVRRLLPDEKPEGELPLGDPTAPEYELIFGHRRRRAALVAGLPALQAKVYHGLSRRQATAIALIENLQRVDINPMEEAEGYEQLMQDEQLTQEGVAARVGRPRSTVTHSLGLLKLPEVIRSAVRTGDLAAEHAKALGRFVPKTDAAREQWAKDVPHWPLVVSVMAEQAILQKVGREYLEKGVPFISNLTAAGLAVRIDQFGEHRVNPKQREHPAYHAIGDGDWVCLNPDHWAAEVADRRKRAAEKEEADRRRRAEELEKLTKGTRKQLRIDDLNREDYREFQGASEGLIALVPDEKKAAAKGDAGRTTIVTDVDLADRLEKAMLRAIRENRRAAIADLDEKVRKKLARLKRVTPRELAWLVFLVADYTDQGNKLHLDAAVAKQLGTKLPSAAMMRQSNGIWFTGDANVDAPKRLAALAKCEIADLVRVLIAERLPAALEEIVASGPASTGALFVKWWLDTDTLWLLEETDEGRAQLVETVKASKWYARILSGDKTAEGEE